jgi:hypothetical protein
MVAALARLALKLILDAMVGKAGSQFGTPKPLIQIFFILVNK